MKKITTNCSIFLQWFYFFLMGRPRTFCWIRIKFHLRRAKRRGKRGYGQNEVYFCKIHIIKWDTNFISQTVDQPNFWPPPLQLAHPKTWIQGLSSDFKQFFPVKNNFVHFQEQIWLPNRKCYGKNMKCYEQAPSLPLESKYISLKQIKWIVLKIWHDDSIIGIFLNFFLYNVKLLFEVKLF